MNRVQNVLIYAMFALLFAGVNYLNATPFSGETIQIPVATVIDKIRGGLLGQILGDLNGLPHEFRYIAEPGNVKNYIPSLPNGAWTDDDTDFEWVYVVEMQKSRNVFFIL